MERHGRIKDVVISVGVLCDNRNHRLCDDFCPFLADRWNSNGVNTSCLLTEEELVINNDGKPRRNKKCINGQISFIALKQEGAIIGTFELSNNIKQPLQKEPVNIPGIVEKEPLKKIEAKVKLKKPFTSPWDK